MTGSAKLLDKISYQITHNIASGLLIAFLVISIIVGLMFRSVQMVLIVLISNIIPLLLMAAIMSILGIYLKADTSTIFAISFGIAVDDSIHFISKYRLELGKGNNRLYALKRTYLTTGKAIIVTTLVLLCGFISLLFSSFGGTFYIGLLISLCLVFAVIIDLSLLPILIMYFYKEKK
jgi:predicted RND superfamily exporter protein